MHVILSLKLKDQEGLALFVHGQLLKRTRLRSWSRSWPMHSWVQFLSTAEASPGLPGASWQLLLGCQHPGHWTMGISVSVLYVLFYFSIC